jgi:hypothetical protein
MFVDTFTFYLSLLVIENKAYGRQKKISNSKPYMHFSAISPDAAHVVIPSPEWLSETTPKIYWATCSITWTPTPDYMTYHDSADVLSKMSNTSAPLHVLPKLHHTPRLPLPLHLPLIGLPPDSLTSTTVFTRFLLLMQQHHQFSAVAARTPAPLLTVGDKVFLHVELYWNTAGSVLDSCTPRCLQYFPLWPPFTFHAAPLSHSLSNPSPSSLQV